MFAHPVESLIGRQLTRSMTHFFSSPWWGLLGLILTLLFGAISIIQYLKSRRFKQIVYTGMVATIQTRNHPEISIMFQGKEIKNLWKLLVLCWNAGTSDIRGSDMPSTERPHIKFPDDARILSFKLLEQSSPSISFVVEQTNNSTIDLEFEYLNPRDGGVVEILYESLNDEPILVELEAKLIGGRDSSVKRYQARSRFELVVGIVSFVIGLVYSVMMLLGSRNVFARPSIRLILLEGFVGLVAVMCFYVAMKLFRSYADKRLPMFAVKYFEGKS